jgi:hypothetical protein
VSRTPTRGICNFMASLIMARFPGPVPKMTKASGMNNLFASPLLLGRVPASRACEWAPLGGPAGAHRLGPRGCCALGAPPRRGGAPPPPRRGGGGATPAAPLAPSMLRACAAPPPPVGGHVAPPPLGGRPAPRARRGAALRHKEGGATRRLLRIADGPRSSPGGASRPPGVTPNALAMKGVPPSGGTRKIYPLF